MRAAVLFVNHQGQPRTRLRQTLPGIPGQLSLLVERQLIGASTHDLAGSQPLRGHHDGLKYIGAGHDEQGNRLAFFFCHSHHCGEQFLFVMIENLAGFENAAAAEAMLAVIQPSAHDHDVLLGSLRVPQHGTQVV
jgi:hypothetical protein